MNVQIEVIVSPASFWSSEAVTNKVELKFEQPSIPSLPWATICAGLVEAALTDFAAQETADE
jgi:hypothetical protein